METTSYETIETTGAPIKCWTRGVAVEDEAKAQLRKVAQMPFVWPHVAVMPDVHKGIGATVGSVIATRGAVIPAAVGVDIGCGMMAARTSLTASDLPTNLKGVRDAIERAVPVGRTDNGGNNDRGAWQNPPEIVRAAWKALEGRYQAIIGKHTALDRGATYQQLGTLGTGNHFIELCLDEQQRVWVMLHSGSRGVGNRIGSHFIALAREEMHALGLELADRDLSYLREGTAHFDEYVEAVSWAQDYAAQNRELMMRAVCAALRKTEVFPAFEAKLEAVNCHHNYISRETHFGEELLVTRKGAVRARRGDLGIIPGSMGARSFIVRGKENADSFHSCSHGAGRALSRTAAKKRFTVDDHAAATAGVECRKDEGVIDETPAAYKPIDDVMRAQSDLVEIVYTLKQVVCVKG
jgi:tRNA-splicing ligase RtcB (3'-phosphate/5'-hydroxy nucleic acid ligase)